MIVRPKERWLLKILPSAVPANLTSDSAGDILDFIHCHCVVVCSRCLRWNSQVAESLQRSWNRHKCAEVWNSADGTWLTLGVFLDCQTFQTKHNCWSHAKERSAWRTLLKDGSGEAGSAQIIHGHAVLKELSSGQDSWWWVTSVEGT